MNGADPPVALNVLIGLPMMERGPSYTCARVSEAMADDRIGPRVFAPLNRMNGNTPAWLDSGLGKMLSRLPFPLTHAVAGARIERRFRDACDGEGAVAYLWGENSLKLARRLADHATPVFREKFNCAKAVASPLLHAEYDRLGAPRAFHEANLSDRMIAKEAEELALADFIFCPSPMVTRSLIETGIAPGKLLSTSYGWDPARLAGEHRALPPGDGVTLLFVGHICVRKGAHILLEAWAKAQIKGRLVLLGSIETLVAERYAELLDRDDVIHHNYSEDVGAYYRSADYFVFPSLEEGGPQVTYEAAGCGVPSIVSPMGAGAFARDGAEGIVIDSADPEVWAELFATLPAAEEHRRTLAGQARARADVFTWDKVGAQRRSLMLEALGWDSAQ